MTTETAASERTIIARMARRSDIPFLARIIELASTPPFPVSLWRAVLDPVETPTLPFVEALLHEGAFAWGEVSEFVVVEVDGTPAAACAVFLPADENRRPVRLDRLPAVAARLGWDAARTEAFLEACNAVWTAGDETALSPQAGAIVEAVGVLPAFRGLGLGDRLMEEAKAAARARGATDLGVSAITGNDAAHRLYERHFAPVMTLHAAMFDGQFPGETKFRAVLDA